MASGCLTAGGVSFWSSRRRSWRGLTRQTSCSVVCRSSARYGGEVSLHVCQLLRVWELHSEPGKPFILDCVASHTFCIDRRRKQTPRSMLFSRRFLPPPTLPLPRARRARQVVCRGAQTSVACVAVVSVRQVNTLQAKMLELTARLEACEGGVATLGPRPRKAPKPKSSSGASPVRRGARGHRDSPTANGSKRWS